MSQYFIDKLVYNNDTLDIHDTEAREMIANNTTNIQAVSARVTKNANDIDALENTTDELREDVDSLDDRMGVAETEIDGLKTRTTNLEGRMNTAENRLDGHDTKISDLEDRMDTAENNIIALDGRMTAAENDIDAAEHRLDLVEAKNDEQDIAIDDLEENVAKNTADIVDIKDDLTGIHEDIEDLDDRITASTYEAGIGIYFGQGVEHTNINVEDEILDQINQNTIDIQNLKTRVTNVENRLTVVEGDITDIKAEIVNIKADITALDVRVTALEAKILPAGGTAGQVLKKNSSTDYDVVWGDDLHIVVDNTRTIPSIPNFDKRLTGNQAVINNYLPVAVAGSTAVTYIKSRAYTYDQFDREYKPTVDVEIHPRSDDGVETTRGCVKLHGLHYNSGAVGGSERWMLDGITFDLGKFTIGDGTDASVVTFATSLTAEQKTLLSDVVNALYNPTEHHFFNGSFTHLAYNTPIGNTDRISNVNCEIHKSGNNIFIAAEGSFIPGPDPYATGYQLGMILFKIVYNVTTDTVSTFDYRWLG